MTVELAVGLAWGVLAAVPLWRMRARSVVSRRFPRREARAGAVRRPSFGPLGRVLGAGHRRRVARRAAEQLDHDLPAALDLLAVAVGAGAPPARALVVAARWAPPSVAGPLERVDAATRLGAGLADALAHLVEESPRLAPVAEVLETSGRLGAPAAGTLSRLAGDARAQARRRAEIRARSVPVKLLFPLVLLVLPAFVLLTVVPALLSAMSRL